MKGIEWVDLEDFIVIVENEFLGVVVVIEVVVKKLEQLKFWVKFKEVDEFLNFEEQILEVVKFIVVVISVLVKVVLVVQRELVV